VIAVMIAVTIVTIAVMIVIRLKGPLAQLLLQRLKKPPSNPLRIITVYEHRSEKNFSEDTSLWHITFAVDRCCTQPEHHGYDTSDHRYCDGSTSSSHDQFC
jgi:hypothetical protein